jgi:threonine/homoserine/homoserine lactone efflux protein
LTETFEIFATLMAAQVVIALAPGPNTLIVIHAATRDRRLGLAAAAGVWPVGLLFAGLGLSGLGTVLAAWPQVAEAMRLACAAYLLWLGFGTIRRSFADPATALPIATPADLATAFRTGFFTNLTNPKSIAYWASIFAATGASELPLSAQLIAVVAMPTVSFLWYALLTVLVASPPVAAVVDRSRGLLDRIAGGVMILFGARLLLGR